MKMRLPGFIEILRSPDGVEGGGAASAPSAPANPGTGDSGASSSSPAPSPSGDTPSPSSTPASGAPASPASPQPLGDDPFAGYDGPSDDDPALATPPAAPTSKSSEPAAAAAPPAPAPTQTPQAPQPPAAASPGPAATPAQPAQPGPQEAPASVPSPAEPARRGQAILENIDSLADHLSTQEAFKLSEADIEALNTDFAGFLPKLGARLFLRAQASALSQMEQVVPAMIQRYMRADKARSESEGKFYSAWPNIDKAKHGSLVERYAVTYRQMNPQASLEQMIQDVGPMVMMAAKIAATPPAAAPAANGSAGSPQHRMPPATPFQPATGGPASPPVQAQPDAWSGYGAPSQDEE